MGFWSNLEAATKSDKWASFDTQPSMPTDFRYQNNIFYCLFDLSDTENVRQLWQLIFHPNKITNCVSCALTFAKVKIIWTVPEIHQTFRKTPNWKGFIYKYVHAYFKM